MKIRQGFVSNSSSSSFVLDKNGITEKQMKIIQEWVDKNNYSGETSINETKKHFFGKMSYHITPSLTDIMKKNKIDIELLELGD